MFINTMFHSVVSSYQCMLRVVFDYDKHSPWGLLRHLFLPIHFCWLHITNEALLPIEAKRTRRNVHKQFLWWCSQDFFLHLKLPQLFCYDNENFRWLTYCQHFRWFANSKQHSKVISVLMDDRIFEDLDREKICFSEYNNNKNTTLTVQGEMISMHTTCLFHVVQVYDWSENKNVAFHDKYEQIASNDGRWSGSFAKQSFINFTTVAGALVGAT